MSWQDRDYARPYSTYGGPTFRRGGSWLIRGSLVTTLIVINVAIFVIGVLFPKIGVLLAGTEYQTPAGFAVQHGLFEMWGRAVLRGQVWRLITAQYLHAHVFHLFFNMLALHFFGRMIEARWTARKFFTIYTLSGLVGNLFYSLLTLRGVVDPDVRAVGASGSIFGLLGISAVMFPSQVVYVQFLFPVRVRTLAMILAGVAFLTLIERGRNYGGEACHLAGLVFGAWYAWRGEHWWQTTEWRIPGFRRKPTTYTSTRSESTWSGPQTPVDESELDRILKKVFDGGVHTLSEAEKTILKNATEQQKREAGSQRGFH